MNIQNVIDYLRPKLGESETDDSLRGFVEMGRKRVYGANGKWPWTRLLRVGTLTLSANVSNYTFPESISTDYKVGKILIVKGQGANDKPIDFYAPEAFMHTKFDNPLEGAVVTNINDTDGIFTIKFSNAPTEGKTLDVWYRQKLPADFTFVAEEDEGLFFLAALMYGLAGSKNPQDRGRLRDVTALYNDALNAAILNDYTTSEERRIIAPPEIILVMQQDLLTANESRLL